MSIGLATGAPCPARRRQGAAPKRFRRGTHRTCPPQETLERLQPLLPAMGITRIANITGLDRIGLPVATVSRPNARSLAVAQGKGLTLEAAKASAVMEAVETYHAERITRALKLASFDELAGDHPLVDVAGLPQSRERGYAPHRRLLWIEGRDLLGDTDRWLPYELAHTDYTLPRPAGSGCFAANTNGLASGNHLLEAICHGLCEVIERDAITLWQLDDDAARRARALDLDSVDDPDCRDVLERLRAAAMAVRVWDVTSDIGVAACYCLIAGRDTDGADPEFGGGCHPSRDIALLRALTEAAQARTTYIAGARDDFGPRAYAGDARARRRHACRRLLADAHPGRRFDRIPSQPSDDVGTDLDWVLGRLRQAGIGQAQYVDLSRPELGVPVVRVVVPGLEGADKGPDSDYVPGPRARRKREGGQ